MPTRTLYKIGIVDDHQILRDAFARLINDKIKGFQVTLSAENGWDMIGKLKQCSPDNLPDIIIMDINMPIMNGFEAVDWLTKNYPDIRILVMTMYSGEEYILKMLALGVNSYLTKNSSTDEVTAALQALAKKENYYTDEVAQIAIRSLKKSNSSEEPFWDQYTLHLSEKEKQFVRLACTDLTYAEIAKELSISPRSAEALRVSLFEKLNVKSRVGLVMWAIRNDVVEYKSNQASN